MVRALAITLVHVEAMLHTIQRLSRILVRTGLLTFLQMISFLVPTLTILRPLRHCLRAHG